MWKKTVLVLGIFSSSMWANEPHFNQAPAVWKNEHTTQRQHFLVLERLLKQAEKQRIFSSEIATLAEKLIDPDYPLLPDAVTLLVNYQLNLPENQSFSAKKALIDRFSQSYPQIIQPSTWQSVLFEALYHQQRFADVVSFSQGYLPESIENQCRLLAARHQLLAEQWQPNPEAEQAGVKVALESAELTQLLAEFESLWLAHASLPSDCNAIQRDWQDKGLKTADIVKQKAVKLFEKGEKKAVQTLSLNSNGELAEWLNTVSNLLNTPKNLQNLAVSHPLEPYMKAVVMAAFGRYINLLPEQMDNPDFGVYQNWAVRWGLSSAETDSWKIRFIQRFFDNQDPIFQLWRDEQLKSLKVDSLTERRIRMAIWQQTDLNEWLGLLSNEAKNKAEWRYWIAKNDPNAGRNVLQALAMERGFYPMLAARALNQPYILKFPTVETLNISHDDALLHTLDRIAELRELGRLTQAKSAWLELLTHQTFEQKLAISQYAIDQKWFDLAVEGTIQAKAWDYIPLRLPNAYSSWFDAILADKPIRKSFVMAIARQESAWNVQARSSANAIGLMQMLPSTAAETAKKYQLPYQREQDLLDPLHNILLGATHLAELNEKYPNNRILIAAAYNAGASRVERWLARAGGRLAMDEFIASIPFLETRGYVQNVLAYDYYYRMLYEKQQNLFHPEEDRRY
ncbi:MAG: transglycosylase SLT domain-containing protein [Pasteurellaceae bacterium]|nr:transglycosylase SLT domain-containing protein [Pasteurellaceae bacterium]